MSAVLRPDHECQLIDESGISPGVVAARGYRSVTAIEAATLGFAANQCRDGLAIPQWSLAGVQVGWMLRPDQPRVDKNGKAVKYEAPAGSAPVLDIHPHARHLLRDASVTLYFTEGNKKADAAWSRGLPTVALSGVWHFLRGKRVIPDLDEVALEDRLVRIVYDSDVVRKSSVAQALYRLCEALRRRGARVEIVYLPEGPQGAKVGLDDWFVAEATVEELERLAVPWDGEPLECIGGNTVNRPETARLVITSLADIEPKEVEWIWDRWLARGKLHLLGGHAGDGKSTLAAALAAIGSVGGVWPDGSPAPCFRTLFVLGEDSADDTLRPRLDRHGADVTRISHIAAVLDGTGQHRFFNVSKHLDLLEAAIVEHAIDLIVIDPLTTIMPGANRNAEGDTRDALTPLVKLAERRNVAILGIAHVGKPDGTARRAMQRILGATAFHAMARVVMMIGTEGGEQMALGVVKTNLAKKPVPILWSGAADGSIAWEGTADCDMESLFATPAKPSRRADAEEFLREFLMGGMKLATEVERKAMDVHISVSTLRRAAETIGILKWKDQTHNGPWYWSLPPSQPRKHENDEVA